MFKQITILVIAFVCLHTMIGEAVPGNESHPVEMVSESSADSMLNPAWCSPLNKSTYASWYKDNDL